MNEYVDYIIVGSGPAGSVIAKRLSERTHRSICILEAGCEDKDFFIRVPAGFVKTLYGGKITWNLQTEPALATHNRKIAMPQGRVVGGSSSVNGLVYSRGQREDFDDWEKWGNPGWGYADVLPYFKRSERRLGPADPTYRGTSGELPITNPDWTSPLCDAFIKGCKEFGIPANQDYNGAEQTGAGYFQRYIYKNKRVNCSDAFLRPAIQTGRVTLKADALATEILFEGRRAVGVKYTRNGTTHTLYANHEVIISAGAVNSPKLLQLSGIGPHALLAQHGIVVKHALPGVGANFRDHYTVRSISRAKSVITLNELSKGWRLGREIMRWFMGKPSILSLSPSMVHVFWSSRYSPDRGDIQVLFTPASYKPGSNYVLDDLPGMSTGARQQRPESSGYVHIQSKDPLSVPLVQPNFLDHELDQRTIVEALKIARQLMATSAMAPYLVQELQPGKDVSSDDEWLDYARQKGTTGYHMVGTCKMGRREDPMAVVDATLRVHGLENLRIADASVMPQVPSANTLAASLMIGEKAADMILANQAG
ncbi:MULTISPECIES: GMC family oxidoreductase [unclassified Achromobacter]|uniref:GMC family oxidoreductase n=1 Tax=unclassified Achromobacter TaxID=2626865 RepID=UPI000B51CE00|nr:MULTISPECIES: GMC family oxidoreductase N-terminal domain-containing protein [unclassified Achromobacter]OWT76789.1 choline dehydrogenase [Achromobacter sp. HZ28]OWT77669.1 choline dehydrogenase [Achromobacter sp. HZ34]